MAAAKGFFTDTTLCIGCKACEVACKQWNQLPDDGFLFTGHVATTTPATSARRTWRHVAFVEQPLPAWPLESAVRGTGPASGCAG